MYFTLHIKCELITHHNERSDVIENDGRVPVDALKTDDYGDAAGEFLWEHEGSGLTDQQVVNAGDELLVK